MKKPGKQDWKTAPSLAGSQVLERAGSLHGGRPLLHPGRKPYRRGQAVPKSSAMVGQVRTVQLEERQCVLIQFTDGCHLYVPKEHPLSDSVPGDIVELSRAPR